MTLEFYEYEKCGRVQNRIVECPLCGHEFSHREPRWRHFFNDHTPEDAGLAPLGTIPEDAGGPLWSDSPDSTEEPVV
ncbi:hypothetical protein [Halobacterium sp. R2-5]|uniref:hypothetical protein n=1 Tax=Halobacterium sp. R2-5 TaxID=2715751 RepID=UPI001421A6B1|nr:hypothetical protein [Halobacterium sp. R2-5]NIB99404.1 hypothetical protein [Halobacterium sp. R2-5]